MLPYDIQWYIWKLYFSNNVVNDVRCKAKQLQIKRHYKSCVLAELLTYAVGDYIAKLINDYIERYPNEPDVLNNTTENWDLIYYALMKAHLEKQMDLFVFNCLKDAIFFIC